MAQKAKKSSQERLMELVMMTLKTLLKKKEKKTPENYKQS